MGVDHYCFMKTSNKVIGPWGRPFCVFKGMEDAIMKGSLQSDLDMHAGKQTLRSPLIHSFHSKLSMSNLL